MTNPHRDPRTIGLSVSLEHVTWVPHGKGQGKTILSDVSLEIKPGQFWAIIGANGAGKSSLLSAIAGEEVRPTSGVIRVGGEDVTDAINRRIDGVAVVHQNPNDDLLLGYSIAMNVATRQVNNGCHPNRVWACNRAYRTDLARRLASIVPRLRRGVDTIVERLSGGEKQLLNLAVALHLEHINSPAGLILLDEHTSGLDHENSEAVMNYTSQEISATRCTAIMVTHHYEDVVKFCSHALVLNHGRIGSTLDKTDARFTAAGLRALVERPPQGN